MLVRHTAISEPSSFRNTPFLNADPVCPSYVKIRFPVACIPCWGNGFFPTVSPLKLSLFSFIPCKSPLFFIFFTKKLWFYPENSGKVVSFLHNFVFYLTDHTICGTIIESISSLLNKMYKFCSNTPASRTQTFLKILFAWRAEFR